MHVLVKLNYIMRAYEVEIRRLRSVYSGNMLFSVIIQNEEVGFFPMLSYGGEGRLDKKGERTGEGVGGYKLSVDKLDDG